MSSAITCCSLHLFPTDHLFIESDHLFTASDHLSSESDHLFTETDHLFPDGISQRGDQVLHVLVRVSNHLPFPQSRPTFYSLKVTIYSLPGTIYLQKVTIFSQKTGGIPQRGDQVLHVLVRVSNHVPIAPSRPDRPSIPRGVRRLYGATSNLLFQLP